MENKVVLGLSGGVDSAVAALELKRRGYAVHCVYLDNGVGGPASAGEVADALRLPFRVVDIRGALDAHVCHPFYESYLRGETPSPCALCNTAVKFPALLAVADELGAELVSTGHYARVADGPGGRAFLLRADSDNDQSYMLARLTPAQVARCVFPLGSYEKSEVRAMAEEAGLNVAHKPDSMELCFVPGDDYAAWLEQYGPTPPPGDFVDPQGSVLGRHKGIHHYTLGQGSGLGVSGPHKYYVSAIRPETDQVVLSDGSDLFTHTVRCRDLNYLSIDALTAPKVVTARFRHSKGEEAALLYPQADGTVTVETAGAVRAPTPGQLAVFYEGDLVVGSGWIC